MKRLFSAVLAAALLSGCVSEPVLDLPDGPARTFASLPYPTGPDTLCRTPAPKPSAVVVSRTIRFLAGPRGAVRQVPISTGTAFGVWSDKTRIAGIRRYLKQLAGERTVHVNVALLRIGQKKPYYARSFSVPTDRPFLAAAWADGKEERAVSAFFVKAGHDVSPVLDLALLGRGFRFCRTATPDFPGDDVLFKDRSATVKKGAENLILTWEAADGKN